MEIQRETGARVLTGFVQSSEQYLSSGWITRHLIIKGFWVGGKEKREFLKCNKFNMAALSE